MSTTTEGGPTSSDIDKAEAKRIQKDIDDMIKLGKARDVISKACEVETHDVHHDYVIQRATSVYDVSEGKNLDIQYEDGFGGFKNHITGGYKYTLDGAIHEMYKLRGENVVGDFSRSFQIVKLTTTASLVKVTVEE